MSHWGEFTDDSDDEDEATVNPQNIKKVKAVYPDDKLDKVKSLKYIKRKIWEPIIQLQINGALVTQTVEVMDQTDMVQTLIDTYGNKTGVNNYNLNPGHILPQIDFPLENSANLVNEEKFCKPIWFIPPTESKFTAGKPKPQPALSKVTCRAIMRKTSCALARLAGFTDISGNALLLISDAVDDFLKDFVQLIRNVQIIERKERDNNLGILTLEKSYYAQTGTSLLSLHNYYKNQIISKNRKAINEFKETYQIYDKMKKESEQNMQKQMFEQEQGEGSSTNTVEPQPGTSNENIVSYVDMTIDDSSDSAPTNPGNGQGDTIEVIDDASTSEEGN